MCALENELMGLVIPILYSVVELERQILALKVRQKHVENKSKQKQRGARYF